MRTLVVSFTMALWLVTSGCETQSHPCAKTKNFGQCRSACESGEGAACLAGRAIAQRVCDGDEKNSWFDDSAQRSSRDACGESQRLLKKAQTLEAQARERDGETKK